MDLGALKTVLLVKSLGSIAAAARTLDMDPSSVSRIVAGVEDALQVRLFQRTTRRLTVTEEGQIYLDRLQPLLDELDAAGDAARSATRKLSGLLRLTASVAFSERMIVPRLAKFQTAYPGIEIELQSSDSNLDLVEQGIDLAIRLAPAPQGDVISTKLIDTRYFVAASPQFLKAQGEISHPDTLARLNCLTYALPGLPKTWRFRKAGQTDEDVPVSGNLRISNALTVRQATLNGLGIGLLADWLIADDLASGALIRVLPSYDATITEFETAAWALYPNRSYLPRKTRVMIDFLRSEFRGLAG